MENLNGQIKMDKSLFNPKRFELPEHLVLIPQFWHKEYYGQLKQKAYGAINLLPSELLIFDGYAVLTGFLGYPHILTLLEMVESVREKEIYFLGTAGSLNPDIDHPMPLEVGEIYSTEILDHFGPEQSYELKTFPPGILRGYRRVKGVTVDIIQRETAPWLKRQVERGLDFVEMELYPMRVFLGKPFYAHVVASDLLKETGSEIFPDKKRLSREFVKAYEVIETFVKTRV